MGGIDRDAKSLRGGHDGGVEGLVIGGSRRQERVFQIIRDLTWRETFQYQFVTGLLGPGDRALGDHGDAESFELSALAEGDRTSSEDHDPAVFRWFEVYWHFSMH